MPKAPKALAVAAIAAALGAIPTGTPVAAADSIASCSGGDFRWTAVDGAITMRPTLLTFTSVGRLWGCNGPGNISSGTFTGVHIAWSDCMHPADGPLTVRITWDNGEVSTLWAPWPVGMSQPTVGPMEVVDGLGLGSRVKVVAEYEMMTPDMVMGCMGAGVKTGPGRLSASMM
ncbi:hypothetical protein ACFVUS_38620 [Nocardia sp. NPDC058058]|uniref:hypothetical protein n=1 Tax=Nocardia sp. NPDC058058 TaxID=3346317 RepID=UPI0036DF6FED